MKQLVLISGKGGTGKTVITSSFATFADNKVMVDCDVDAADLHILLDPTIKKEEIFKSGKTAETDKEKCIDCGRCKEVCRFDAVRDDFTINPISCDGCEFCKNICPTGAIEMNENIAGEWFISETRFGTFVHARLGVAEDNSGKLVTLIREKAKDLALEEGKELIVIDGTPGIGCPVIASLSGVDLALVIIEPTMSGLHDAKRVIEVARHFDVSVAILINKYDLNEEITGTIEAYAAQEGIDIVGKLKFDKSVVEAMVAGKTAAENGSDEVKETLKRAWNNVKTKLAI